MCWSNKNNLDLSGNGKLELTASNTLYIYQAMSKSKQIQRGRNVCVGHTGNNPEAHRQWEARVDGPADTLDLSGNVGAGVRR